MQWTAKICMPQQDVWKWGKWTIVLLEKSVISMASRSKLQYKEAENEIRYLVLHWAEIKVAIKKAGLVLSFRLYYIKIYSRYSQEDKKRPAGSSEWSIQLRIVSHRLNPTYFNILSLSSGSSETKFQCCSLPNYF